MASGDESSFIPQLGFSAVDGCVNDDLRIVSVNVQSIANDIYKEFERLIKKFGNEVLQNLVPLVVSALEHLDTLYTEHENLKLVLSLLREDHSQLSSQFEKEKRARKSAEKDELEDDRKQFDIVRNGLESTSRILETKVELLKEHGLSIPNFVKKKAGFYPGIQSLEDIDNLTIVKASRELSVQDELAHSYSRKGNYAVD
ncbi:unnamed protein product [Protopolystoma xenopodis]|uniref:RH1 domain-containing protein n=1 Tax=Protopolystoma xenopodis TaxID=117903 RepID=A0A448X5X9_9PLAT|nr:unnamed protein product [Protopolystoma xenopodis]